MKKIIPSDSEMIKITKNNINDVIAVLSRIPEFNQVFTKEFLMSRLSVDHLILVACIDKLPVGCKIGYDRYNDGSFYSWLGGVIPDYRNKGVAQKLTKTMELFAIGKGYDSIVFKTRNMFKPMLSFAIKNGYQIIDFEKKDNPEENRIILKKQLSEQFL